MFAVRVVILMIFCAHIVSDNGNSMANAATFSLAIASEVGAPLEMHKSDGSIDGMVATANTSHFAFDSTSSRVSSEISSRALRGHESHDALDDSILDSEPADNGNNNRAINIRPTSGVNDANGIIIATANAAGRAIALRFMSSLEPMVEFLRTFAKRAFSTYDRYQPELNFGKCMMKYARKQYPEMMRQFRMQNIGRLGYSVYSTVSEFVTNAMNGPQYDESLFDQGRIGTKVAQMTVSRPVRMGIESMYRASVRRRPQIVYKSGQLNQLPSQAMQLGGNVTTNRTTAYAEERTDLANMEVEVVNEPRRIKEKRSLDMDPPLYVGPRQFPPYPMPLTTLALPEETLIDWNQDEDVRLANKPVEDIVEDMLDWESIVLEGVGIDPKAIQKDSPMFCAKEYVFSFVRRFVHNFVLA